jgi:hypothetical protein
MTESWGSLDGLFARAETLAGAWGARARASTTVGQERALLRLYGVHGLDRAGRPLAGTAVDRWRAGAPEALPAGITLPFAMALLEYDLQPQQLALDVASDAIDLALEAELLREPDRRAVAEAEARRLVAGALERIDANRTARLEILALLGDRGRPWLGTTLVEPDVESALEESARLVGAGADLLRIEVPVGRELVDRLHDAGIDVAEWQPRDHPGRPADRTAGEPVPVGSQRGLAELRRAIDEVAAERRGYIRLATAAPALGVPEGAVVAGFERIDIVEADPMTEIVAGGVDPDRALSDHAFAHRLHRRAGTLVAIGAGPLVVAPDLSSGQPSDPATRAGRALALQLMAAAFARGNGLPPEQVVLGAFPAWLADESAPGARVVAEVTLRRALFTGHPLTFDEPITSTDRSAVWPALVAAALPFAGPTSFVVRHPAKDAAAAQRIAREARAAAAVAAEVASSTAPRPLAGTALDHARAVVAAAGTTLDLLADQGWRAVVGDPPAGRHRGRLGAEAVTERTEGFDPFAEALGSRP